jgi:hypothetical protein
MDTIYRVVCPDGEWTTKKTYTSRDDALELALELDVSHDEAVCTTKHRVQRATWEAAF